MYLIYALSDYILLQKTIPVHIYQYVSSNYKNLFLETFSKLDNIVRFQHKHYEQVISRLKNENNQLKETIHIMNHPKNSSSLLDSSFPKPSPNNRSLLEASRLSSLNSPMLIPSRLQTQPSPNLPRQSVLIASTPQSNQCQTRKSLLSLSGLPSPATPRPKVSSEDRRIIQTVESARATDVILKANQEPVDLLPSPIVPLSKSEQRPLMSPLINLKQTRTMESVPSNNKSKAMKRPQTNESERTDSSVTSLLSRNLKSSDVHKESSSGMDSQASVLGLPSRKELSIQKKSPSIPLGSSPNAIKKQNKTLTLTPSVKTFGLKTPILSTPSRQRPQSSRGLFSNTRKDE